MKAPSLRSLFPCLLALAALVTAAHAAPTRTVAGTGVKGFSGDGGPATEARFSWPADTLLLDDGTLVVADMQNGRVRTIGGVATP